MIEKCLNQEVDVLILSNGPGELITWVKPMVQALRQNLGNNRQQVRISVVLSPCSNASGQEAAIARSYPEVDRTQSAEHFWPFLLTGKTAEFWEWHRRGVVLFLGGDQFFPLVLGKRLGYRTVIYAEWKTRWLPWIDRFGVMRPQTLTHVPEKYAHKVTIVGDLMAEVAAYQHNEVRHRQGEFKDFQASTFFLEPGEELIGILPGSKAAKLAQGVPLMLAIAEQVHQARPQSRFVIPVAPTLEVSTLSQFADPAQNPIVALVDGVAASLQQSSAGLPYLKTQNGLRVNLWITPPGTARTPPYALLKQCQLCLTTVGANTAELAALAVPMVVILPTQQLDAMRAWNGIPGLLANLPGLGIGFAKVINWIALRRVGLLAWPNIWAKTAIVPELVGRLEAKIVAEMMVDYLAHPEKLQDMKTKLRQVRGEPGAAQKLTQIVKEEIEKSLAQ